MWFRPVFSDGIPCHLEDFVSLPFRLALGIGKICAFSVKIDVELFELFFYRIVKVELAIDALLLMRHLDIFVVFVAVGAGALAFVHVLVYSS